MSEAAAREMVADWYGAGYAIHGRDDLSEWFKESIGRMAMHRTTRAFVTDLVEGHDDYVCRLNHTVP